MRASTVATVFKVLILSVLLMCAFSVGTNLYIIFSTTSQIDSIGSAMKSELAKNNMLLYESVYGQDGTGGEFAKQLMNVTGGQSRSDRTTASQETAGQNITNAYYLKRVDIYDPTSNTRHTLFKVEDDGSISTTYTSSDLYYSDTIFQGNYGDFRTIEVTYDVVLDWVLPGMKEQGKGVTNVQHRAKAVEQTFSYTTPCLRYLK